MSTQLEQAIANAYKNDGDTSSINKVHLEFLKANFIIPIEKSSSENDPKVLFLQQQEHSLLPVFSDEQSLKQWATDIVDEIDLLYLTGVNLLKGLGENVFVCLNPGTELYKEFHPQELAKLKMIVAKFFNKD